MDYNSVEFLGIVEEVSEDDSMYDDMPELISDSQLNEEYEEACEEAESEENSEDESIYDDMPALISMMHKITCNTEEEECEEDDSIYDDMPELVSLNDNDFGISNDIDTENENDNENEN